MLTPLKSLYAFIILFLNLVMILCSRSRSHPHLAQKMCHIGKCSLPQKCLIKLMAVARLTVFILEIDTLIPQSITKCPPQLIVNPPKLDSPMHTFFKIVQRILDSFSVSQHDEMVHADVKHELMELIVKCRALIGLTRPSTVI